MTEVWMTPEQFRAIHDASGMTARELAKYLRIADDRAVRRYRSGEAGVSGPASKLMEQLMNQLTAQPVAWMYEGPRGEVNLKSERDENPDELIGWGFTETPLYAAPPASNKGGEDHAK